MEVLQPYVTFIFILLLFSAFIKCATTFSILRYGIGLSGVCINTVFFLLALVISLFVLAPQVENLGGIDKLLKTKIESVAELDQKFTPILEKNVEEDLLEKFEGLALKIKAQGEELKSEEKLSSESKFFTLLLAYSVSEVKKAFEIGLLLLIPFFVIDLVVTNILLLLGATNIKESVVAIPLKILLFFAVDGWGLLSGKIINDYF